MVLPGLTSSSIDLCSCKITLRRLWQTQSCAIGSYHPRLNPWLSEYSYFLFCKPPSVSRVLSFPHIESVGLDLVRSAFGVHVKVPPFSDHAMWRLHPEADAYFPCTQMVLHNSSFAPYQIPKLVSHVMSRCQLRRNDTTQEING